MILVMPDNPERAPHDDGNDSPYPEDGRFYRLSFNVNFITSQAATVISSVVVSLFSLELCTPGGRWTRVRVFRKHDAWYESRNLDQRDLCTIKEV